jgi:tRNA dimethylallyltransferase
MPGPAADPALRARLEREAETNGRQALHERLRQVDPESAAVIAPEDLVRVIRALELYELTGQSASQHRARHAFSEARYPFDLIVLSPPREQLYAAIDRRAKAMFEQGLVEETRALVARGFRETQPMRSVGYVQALAVLDGTMRLDEAIADTARQSRRYAKRQLTWFRKERGAMFATPEEAAARLATNAG